MLVSALLGGGQLLDRAIERSPSGEGEDADGASTPMDEPADAMGDDGMDDGGRSDDDM